MPVPPRRQASGARLVLVRRAPGIGTPRRWRRYSVCVSDANFHPARAMSDVSKHNRMEFVDFPPSLFSPLSLCTKLLLPVSPLCLPARWGKILNIHQMMQVILVLRDFFSKICLNSSILRVAFYLSKILDLTIFSQFMGFFCPFNQVWTILHNVHAYLKALKR